MTIILLAKHFPTSCCDGTWFSLEVAKLCKAPRQYSSTDKSCLEQVGNKSGVAQSGPTGSYSISPSILNVYTSVHQKTLRHIISGKMVEAYEVSMSNIHMLLQPANCTVGDSLTFSNSQARNPKSDITRPKSLSFDPNLQLQPTPSEFTSRHRCVFMDCSSS